MNIRRQFFIMFLSICLINLFVLSPVFAKPWTYYADADISQTAPQQRTIETAELPKEEKTNYWWWVLGIIVVGGVAAAAASSSGGGDGGNNNDGNTSTPDNSQTGTATVNWETSGTN